MKYLEPKELNCVRCNNEFKQSDKIYYDIVWDDFICIRCKEIVEEYSWEARKDRFRVYTKKDIYDMFRDVNFKIENGKFVIKNILD